MARNSGIRKVCARPVGFELRAVTPTSGESRDETPNQALSVVSQGGAQLHPKWLSNLIIIRGVGFQKRMGNPTINLFEGVCLHTSVIRKVCARFGGFELHSVSPLPALPASAGERRERVSKIQLQYRDLVQKPPLKKVLNPVIVRRVCFKTHVWDPTAYL